MNANAKIKAAMRAREQWVLKQIRAAAKEGLRWQPEMGLTSVQTYNAIERLVARDRIMWIRHRRWSFTGYEEVK